MFKSNSGWAEVKTSENSFFAGHHDSFQQRFECSNRGKDCLSGFGWKPVVKNSEEKNFHPRSKIHHVSTTPSYVVCSPTQLSKSRGLLRRRLRRLRRLRLRRPWIQQGWVNFIQPPTGHAICNMLIHPIHRVLHVLCWNYHYLSISYHIRFMMWFVNDLSMVYHHLSMM